MPSSSTTLPTCFRHPAQALLCIPLSVTLLKSCTGPLLPSLCSRHCAQAMLRIPASYVGSLRGCRSSVLLTFPVRPLLVASALPLAVDRSELALNWPRHCALDAYKRVEGWM